MWLIWQLVVPKVRGDDPWQDWPDAGICSPATVEGNRVYVVSNRAEVLCLDLNGQTDGKVYVGSRRGEFYIFAAGKEKKLLCSVVLDSDVNAPPTVSDGVLYLATMRKLYAIQQPATGQATAK